MKKITGCQAWGIRHKMLGERLINFKFRISDCKFDKKNSEARIQYPE